MEKHAQFLSKDELLLEIYKLMSKSIEKHILKNDKQFKILILKKN